MAIGHALFQTNLEKKEKIWAQGKRVYFINVGENPLNSERLTRKWESAQQAMIS